MLLSLLVGACSGETAATAPPPDGPGAGLRALTGTRTRVVWVQEDGTDPLAFGSNLALMGLDTDDSRGERIITAERRSYVKPLLTPSGDRVVFSSRTPEGARIFVVNWDGTGLTPLGAGYALAAWRHPSEGSEWVYATVDTEKQPGPPNVSRFRIDRPHERELVWNKTPVALDSFQVSSDGRRAAGLFPWPDAGIAELPNGSLRKLGEGCWTALAHARGPLLWYFDGLAPQRDHGGSRDRSAVERRPQSGARIRRRGGLLSAMDQPFAIPGDLRSVQSGRRQSGPKRRRSG